MPTYDPASFVRHVDKHDCDVAPEPGRLPNAAADRSPQGTPPTPRFDHCAVIFPVTPNSATFDKLLVMGGRDLSGAHTDAHVLDLEAMAWQADAAALNLPYEISNNLCSGVESVPYHKVVLHGRPVCFYPLLCIARQI